MLNSKKCIICENSQLTKEHIIPKFLGGTLVGKILCKECNNRFGTDLIASLKYLAGIYPSIDYLCSKYKNSKKLRKLKQNLLTGQVFEVTTPAGTKTLAFLKDNRVFIKKGKQEDGSLILSEKEARGFLSKRFPRLKDSVFRPSEEKIELGVFGNHKYSIINFQPNIGKIKPKYKIQDEKIKKAFLLIAFEFLSFFVGPSIFHPYFDDIREVFLLDKNLSVLSDKINIIGYYLRTFPQPYHLIYPSFKLKGNTAINIRLFSHLEMQVRFKRLYLQNFPEIPFLEDLRRGKTYVAKTIADAKSNKWIEI